MLIINDSKFTVQKIPGGGVQLLGGAWEAAGRLLLPRGMGLLLQNGTRLSQSSPLAGIWSNSWVPSNQYPGWFTAQLQSYCQNKYSVYSTETSSYTETFYKYCLSLFPFREPQQRYLPTQHCCCLRAFPQSSLVGIAPNLPEKRRLIAWHSFLGAFFTMKHPRSITVRLLGSCHRCLQDSGGNESCSTLCKSK